MKTILKYILLSATRDKLFTAIIISILLSFGLSNLIGYTSLSEESYMRTIIFAGTSKIILMLGMVIFVCFHINRSFENKEISFMLSKNISREVFIFSYWLGFNLISLFIIFFISLILFLFCSVDILGTLQWLFSIELEIMILSTFTILANFILQSAIFSIFLSCGFYTISKLMGFFLDTITLNHSNNFLNFLISTSNFILKIISSLIPRLDIFSQTRWIIYGYDAQIFKIILLQSIIYIPIIFFMTFYDFKRKQF